MTRLLSAFFAFLIFGAPAMAQEASAPPLTIVIHGGAGALAPGRYTPEEEAAYKATLREALDVGYTVLERGGASLDGYRRTDREGARSGGGRERLFGERGVGRRRR